MPIYLEGTICSSDQYLRDLMHLDQADLKIIILVLSKLQGINTPNQYYNIDNPTTWTIIIEI